MAEIEEAMHTRLTNFAGLVALIATRVYPMRLPQPVDMPAVTYQRIDAPRWSSISGDDGVAEPRMQIDCWATTYAGVKAVATQVRLALQRWDDAAASPAVMDCFLDSDQDIYEEDTELYRVRADYRLTHRESLT